MSDQPNQPVLDTNVQSIPPASTASPSAAPSPATGGGAPDGARPPTSGAPAPSAQREVDLSEVLEWSDGKASLQELIAAKRELEKARGSGYDLYAKAMAGDREAAKQYVERYLGGSPAQSPPSAPTQSAQPAINPASQPSLPPDYEEMRQVYSEIRANQIRNGLGELLKKPDFYNLSLRPGAVDEVIAELNGYYERKVPVTPELVQNVLTIKNRKEKEYQDVLAKRMGVGELAVSDPFRGGSPEAINEARPNPFGTPKEQAAYKTWLGRKWSWARQTDELANQTN